ncbi:BlaR1 family beta-lactam sensor/signal transducer [Clostridia bacterium]|nr:BlaR1 family beta-lactam sensor/signal transducer [Clostridia bacterium]
MAGIFSNFLLTSLGATGIILLVLLLKKGLKKHISPRRQYNIDLLMMAALILPLLPAGIWRFGFSDLLGGGATKNAVSENLAAQAGTAGGTGVNFLLDFSVSVTRFMPEKFILAAACAWLVGAIIFAVALCVCAGRLRLVRESVKPSDNDRLNELLEAAKAELNVKQRVTLGLSVLVKSPMTVGVMKPLVILPFELSARFDEDEVRHVLLHELTHIGRMDSLVNHLLCLLQAVYWWNPLVYIAFHKIREDREISCDYSVLNRLPNGGALRYGETVISFARKRPRIESLSMAMEMGGTKRELIKRIEKIADYKTETRRERLKSAVIFVFTALLVFCQIPAVSALATTAAREEYYKFEGANVQSEDLSSYFGDYQGAFVLYDVQSGQYTIYNEKEATRRVSPASTYKIYSGLIALEEGVITPEKSNIAWDGSAYSIDVWNQDHDLMSGIQNSVSWYFQNLDRQVGAEKLESWFETIGYGNHDLSGGIDGYWMESSLKISPVEQVELLTALYKDETPFSQGNVSAIKSILRLSERDNAALYGKTGTITVNGKMTSGWFIGYVENGGHTTVFALHLEGDNAGGSAAAKTALSILESKDIY